MSERLWFLLNGPIQHEAVLIGTSSSRKHSGPMGHEPTTRSTKEKHNFYPFFRSNFGRIL
jgi:hypothetical protein